MVDIVMKDGSPKLASIEAEDFDTAVMLVSRQFGELAKCGDKEAEEFAANIADYTVRLVENASV